MFRVSNMFREFSMKQVKGYGDLTNNQKSMFDTTYKKHLSSMPLNEQATLKEEEIKKIETLKVEENLTVLKVYFKDDVYLYLPGNVWIKTK